MTHEDTLRERIAIEEEYGPDSCRSCLHWYEDVDKGVHCGSCCEQANWRSCKTSKALTQPAKESTMGVVVR